MIKEAYCSFEVAKLLKEKGFPQDYDIYHSMIYNEKDYEDEYEVQRMVTETRFIKAGTLSSYPVGVQTLLFVGLHEANKHKTQLDNNKFNFLFISKRPFNN